MSVYIDLAVGLALAFLILSLAVSGIQEAFTRLLNVRAKVLWAFLADQFEDVASNPKTPATVWRMLGLAWSRVLGGKLNWWPSDPRPDQTSKRPGGSEQAIEDAATRAAEGTAPKVEDLYDRLADIDRSWIWSKKTHISSVPAKRIATAFLELASLKDPPTVDGAPADAQLGAERLEAARQQVETWVETLSATKLYRPLKGAWLAAGRDVDAFHDRVSEWFDGEMTRMSGLYRRNVRWIMAFIAIFVTLFTGFDSLSYARQILNDQAFRTQVVAVAQGNPERLSDLAELCSSLTARAEDSDQAMKVAADETAATSDAESDGADAETDGAQAEPSPYACIQTLLSDPSLTRILGDSLVVVTTSNTDNATVDFRGSEWKDRVLDWARIWGFGLTVVALMFGAPFWWDLLRRLTGRKSSASAK